MSICLYCLGEFEPYPGKVFCDRRCKERHHRKRIPRRHLATCESCGAEFSYPRRPNSQPLQRFCSKECRAENTARLHETARFRRLVRFREGNVLNRAQYLAAMRGDPCTYCGKFCAGKGPQGAMHLDHITPRAKGGPDWARGKDWENFTAACWECNLAKGRQSLLEFLGWPPGWLTCPTS